MEISFTIPAALRQKVLEGAEKIENAESPELNIEVKKKSKKRSNDANSYLWVLCTQIAEHLQDGKIPVSKEDIYRIHVQDVGVYEELDMAEEAIPRFSEIWRSRGIGWQVQTVDDAEEGRKKVFAYYGSSTYDSRQMARLIDSVVEDCRALGIETIPPEEMASLLEDWRRTHE